MKDFFHQPSTEVVEREVFFEVDCEKMKLRKMEKFEVCFDCIDDSPVSAMGLELAV